jgi:Sterol desaturase
MTEALLAHAGAVRLGAFAAVAALMIGWEFAWPRRRRVVPGSRLRRWPSNFGITFLNGILAHLLIPLGAIGVAYTAERQGWGLLRLLSLPEWVDVVVAAVLLDLVIYFQHVLFHAVPTLWRLHRMHHVDLDLDVSSGGRFHTFEILLSALIKMAAVAALGAPPLAVLIFEVVLNLTAMFNHSNAYLPLGIDRVLRWLVVTPDMHRVHHSVLRRETNSNFGFNLPWWDRIFGTYRAQPQAGHADMVIGIEQFRELSDIRFDRMWLVPFREDTRIYPLNEE